MYVDESGDPGHYVDKNGGNSPHFILSGLIVPVEDWDGSLQRFKSFRQMIKKNYGLTLREEIHATELIRIGKIKAYRKIHKSDRLELLHQTIKELPNIFSSGKVINVCFDKKEHEELDSIKKTAWNRLIQRFDNYLKKVSSSTQRGIIIADGQEDATIRKLLRKMRVYNPMPSKYGGFYQALTNNIIEDVFSRDSKHSYFIQAVDVIAHCLYRKEYPKGSLKKYNADRFFDEVEPLLLKEANAGDPLGIVRA
jgi:hypothetical protein